MSNRNIGRAIMDQNYFEKWKECSEKWNTLFNEANNLGCKLYDDKDMDLNHWHQMDLIQINLLWLKSLLIYEHALSFIEQDISDDERFEVAKIHYHVTGECKIVCVNRYCMNLLYAPYWGKQR